MLLLVFWISTTVCIKMASSVHDFSVQNIYRKDVSMSELQHTLWAACSSEAHMSHAERIANDLRRLRTCTHNADSYSDADPIRKLRVSDSYSCRNACVPLQRNSSAERLH